MIKQWSITGTKAEEEKIKKAISDVNDELAENKKAEEESKSASAQLNEKIEEQQSKLKELKQRYVDVALESGKNSKEARGLQKEMKTLNSELVDSQNKFSGVNEKADSLTWALDDCSGAASSASSGGFTIFKGVLADLTSNVIRGCVDDCKELGASVLESGMSFESSGDVTLMQSAFDGLKQTIFEDADGPLRDVAQGITNELIPAAEDMYADIKEGIAWMDEHKTAVEGVALVVGSLARFILNSNDEDQSRCFGLYFYKVQIYKINFKNRLTYLTNYG